MRRLPMLAALAIVSALATPVVVSATGLTPKEAAAPTVVARTEPAAVAPVAEPACERRIKVVYPAPGISGATACAAPSFELRR
jgi:hypothetical protein